MVDSMIFQKQTFPSLSGTSRKSHRPEHNQNLREEPSSPSRSDTQKTPDPEKQKLYPIIIIK